VERIGSVGNHDTDPRDDITKSVTVGNLDLAYETFGDASHPALLLVMGLGGQMLLWPQSFCEQLAASGRYVIRFDNRDVGLSTHLDGVKVPKPSAVALGRAEPPYDIEDMARDAIGLLDALGIESVDLVGASMGGFISQTVAILAPGRVRTLTLIMSSTGSKKVGYPHPRIARYVLQRRRPRDRNSAIAEDVKLFRTIGATGYDVDEPYLRWLASACYDRAYDPAGVLRQRTACIAQPDRTEQLRDVVAPTLVVHGLEDPLISRTGGIALARAIPHARFVGYWGMGHDLPRPLWEPLAEEILRLVHSPCAVTSHAT
jgi:pimeloyl-ACP methyl ester carboxylesterase